MNTISKHKTGFYPIDDRFIDEEHSTNLSLYNYLLNFLDWNTENQKLLDLTSDENLNFSNIINFFKPISVTTSNLNSNFGIELFDVVLSIQNLDEIKNLDVFVENVYTSLKSNGIFLISDSFENYSKIKDLSNILYKQFYILTEEDITENISRACFYDYKRCNQGTLEINFYKQNFLDYNSKNKRYVNILCGKP